MRKASTILFIIFTTLAWSACKERFDPKLAPGQTNYLVVDGFINGNGFTNITLSRTVPLKDTAKIKRETNAQVMIVGEDNAVYSVREIGSGTYKSDSLVLKASQKYRLHIKTKSGGEYLSEYVAVKQTPRIDSINWKVENNGIQIYANTHDQLNNTRYYKWEYEETWEIHSAYLANVEFKNGMVVPRNTTEINNSFYCWSSQNSTSIILASTARLSNDVINLAPIVFIPVSSEKLSVRYSILVRPYALDQKSYDFYQRMKSNTESLGSIFDPLPSEFTGNITCVSNPSEKVIGFVTASTVDQKRFFILRSEVPATYSSGCQTTYVLNKKEDIDASFGSGALAPYQADPGGFAPAVGYYSSDPGCLECRLRGSSVKPSFW
jgi:Domain of unknown function (DUF4249)